MKYPSLHASCTLRTKALAAGFPIDVLGIASELFQHLIIHNTPMLQKASKRNLWVFAKTRPFLRFPEHPPKVFVVMFAVCAMIAAKYESQMFSAEMTHDLLKACLGKAAPKWKVIVGLERELLKRLDWRVHRYAHPLHLHAEHTRVLEPTSNS